MSARNLLDARVPQLHCARLSKRKSDVDIQQRPEIFSGRCLVWYGMPVYSAGFLLLHDTDGLESLTLAGPLLDEALGFAHGDGDGGAVARSEDVGIG